MGTPREELHKLVEQLSDEQVPGALAQMRAQLAPAPSPDEPDAVWPPAWFAIAEGSASDVSERAEEILRRDLGRPA